MTHDLSYRRILVKMGYYNYQDGLIYHNINQQGDWEEHLMHCRNFILKAIDLYKPDKVTVLGSGWLMDLPVAEISEAVNEVCLVDIIHPPDVVLQVQNLKNVRLIEKDLSGGLISEVWQKARRYSYFRKLPSLENITIPDLSFNEDPGMIISLNILTQLEALPVTYLSKRSKAGQEEFIRFRKMIQQKHIDFIMKHKSVIISDFEEITTKKSGTQNVVPTLLAELPSGVLKEEWIWNFDKPGGDLYNSRCQFRIVALVN